MINSEGSVVLMNLCVTFFHMLSDFIRMARTSARARDHDRSWYQRDSIDRVQPDDDDSTQRAKSESDSEWELIPRTVQVVSVRIYDVIRSSTVTRIQMTKPSDWESSMALGDFLQKAGDWLQWGFEVSWKGVEKTRDGTPPHPDPPAIREAHAPMPAK